MNSLVFSLPYREDQGTQPDVHYTRPDVDYYSSPDRYLYMYPVTPDPVFYCWWFSHLQLYATTTQTCSSKNENARQVHRTQCVLSTCVCGVHVYAMHVPLAVLQWKPSNAKTLGTHSECPD